MQYNPIVRNFGKVRRVLTETLGLPRHAVRPSCKLAELVPPEQRRLVWNRLQLENGSDSLLRFPPSVTRMATLLFWCVFAFFLSGIGGIALLFGGTTLFAGVTVWLVAVVSALILSILSQMFVFQHLEHLATELDPNISVGELTLRMTTGQECREARYQLTHNEIPFKTRVIFAEHLGLRMDQLTPDTNIAELYDGEGY
jgi:hypothetical protein